MKKKITALTAAAMMAGLAHAGVSFSGHAVATTASTLAVSEDGIGHILLVPYFSTNAGNSTLLSMVNTDMTNGKAVKVRFRGAANSDHLFDLHVYMSPGDVWTAHVSQGADGKSTLTTSDRSCTWPSSVNHQPFTTDRLPAYVDNAIKAEWTREGHVEIINMADIVDNVSSRDDLYTRIEHVEGVAPCFKGAKAGLLTALQTDPASVADAESGLLNFRAPSSGLMGSWTVINVAGASVAWSGNMTAIRANTVEGTAGTGRIVFSPQMETTARDVDLLTSDPLLRTANVAEETATANPILTAALFDLPDLSTPYTGAGALAASGAGSPIAQANQLSSVLAVQSVWNEFLTDTSISAATDWTYSMPTRRYGLALNYNTTASDSRVYTTGNLYFSSANTTKTFWLGYASAWHQTCVATEDVENMLRLYDRERQNLLEGFVITGGAPTIDLCGSVFVLSFNGTGALRALIATKSFDATYRDGWLKVPTPGLAGAGLPILGSSFVKATGPVVAGRSTTFSLTQAHRFTR